MARQLSPAYRARRPTETVLYRVLDEYLGRFIDEVEATDRPVPAFVRRELEGILRCGRLEFGFVRQSCPQCSFDRLIGLPCAGRGICPSCLGRRMVEGAARLVDEIIPHVPVRQWVISLPIPLRFWLAYDAQLCSEVLALFLREVFRWLRWTAKRELGLSSVSQAHCGAFTAIHRAGSYGNLNLHWHSGVLDGVYVTSSASDSLSFHALPAPTSNDLIEISTRVYERTRDLLTLRGRDWERPEDLDEGALIQEPLLADCAEASARGVGLLGEQAGQRLLPHLTASAHWLQPDVDVREQTGGFDLQASRRVSRGNRSELERLCRYLLHPPLAHDRLSFTSEGQIRLQFSRPWKNGVDAITLEPLNFIARLIPLVPKPGTHQLRYHGVLAPGSALRAKVIPPRPPDRGQLELFARNGKPGEHAQCNSSSSSPPSSSSAGTRHRLSKLQRIAWARLLERMGAYDMQTCPDCGATLSMDTPVLESAAIARKLAARGLLQPIPDLALSPSRGPPWQLRLDFKRNAKAGAAARDDGEVEPAAA